MHSGMRSMFCAFSGGGKNEHFVALCPPSELNGWNGEFATIRVRRSVPTEHAGSTTSHHVSDLKVQQYNVRLTGTRQGHSNRHTAFNLEGKHRSHEEYLNCAETQPIFKTHLYYQLELYGNPTRPPASTFLLAFPK